MKPSLFKQGFGKSILMLVISGVAASAMADPAQLPLLARSGNAGKPNVMFTLDDSGSMDWEFMPDAAYYNLPSGRSTYRVGSDPSESATWPTGRDRFVATIANDLVSARWRTSQINKVYYNPDIRYTPWFNSDGSTWPDSPPSAAIVEPAQGLAATGNLIGTRTVSTRWCTDANCDFRTLSYTPATYFIFNGGSQTDITNYTRIRIQDFANFERPPGRDDCPVHPTNSPNRLCSQATEYQNFANWFTYYRRRMSLAIAATSRALSEQGDGLRVGFGRINRGNISLDGVTGTTLERGVRDFSSADRIAFFNWLHSSYGNGGTPLRRAMGAVGEYFRRNDSRGPWSDTPGSTVGNSPSNDLACRKSYSIIMSDGYWNNSTASNSGARANVDGSDGPSISGPTGQSYQYTSSTPFRDSQSNTLADVAMYYWNRDLRPDIDNRVKPDSDNPAFWQQLVQFTVGLGVNGSLDPLTDLESLTDGSKTWPGVGSNEGKIDDMWHAAVNSRGRFLSASNPTEFAQALSAILQSIAEREAAEGGAAINSGSLQAGNKKYVPTYQTSRWSGDVLAQLLDANGDAVGSIWKASENLPDPGNRNIVAGQGGSLSPVDFRWASLTSAMKSEMGPNANDNLIEFLRGDRTYEGSGYRQRSGESLLGDMINSTPLLISGLLNEQYGFLPGSIPGGSSYGAFLQQKALRDDVLFVGANDGMLHAFDTNNGAETFAFIPKTSLANLYKLSEPAYDHRMYVDGPLAEADAYLNGAWRNLIVGTPGGGGRSVFALDVTQSDSLSASSVKWEYSHSNLGYVTAPVAVGVMKNGTWAALFGNGLDSSGGYAQLFIVDLNTGALIKKINTGVAGSNGLGGIRLVKDYNNVIVAAYAGDQKGNLWRFDLADTSSSAWGVGFSGQPLFTATSSAPQMIMGAPEYIEHPKGGQLVLFGTGRLYMDSDLGNTEGQTLYGIWDTVDSTDSSGSGSVVASKTELVEQSITTQTSSGGETYWNSTSNSINYTSKRGWFMNMTIAPGQRSIYTPNLVRGFVLFNTLSTAGGTGHVCDPSNSTGYNVLINALTGAKPHKPLFDTNNDGVVDEDDEIVSAYETAADGVDTILLGKNGKVSIQRALDQTTGQIDGRKLERSWRQLLNFPRQ